MVDAIGSRPVSNERAVAQVGRTEPVRAVAAATPEAASSSASTLSAAASEMAASPPVDSDRVSQIRRAVQNGTFPIFPGEIADRLIALANQWNPNDPS